MPFIGAILPEGGPVMTKICKSCGKEYTGEYCEHCGYGDPELKTKAADKYKKIQKPLRHMTEEEKAQYYKEHPSAQKNTSHKSGSKALKIATLFFCIALVAVIVLFVLYKRGYIFSGSDKREVAAKYFESISERDFDKFLSCFPEELKDTYEKEADKMGISDENALDTLYADYREKYGDNFKFTANIGKESKLEESVISDYEKEYKSIYDSSIDVKEASVFSVDAKITGDKLTEQVYYEVYVAKIDGKWCVVNAADISPSISAQ